MVSCFPIRWSSNGAGADLHSSRSASWDPAASCSSGSTLPEPVEDNDPGSISGELVVYIATNEDGTGETQYMLRNEAGVERRAAGPQQEV